MPDRSPNRFLPHRWTTLTWLAVLIWAYGGLASNYPPTTTYTIDPITGELNDPTYYKSLAELPLPVGWPLHYVEPDTSYLLTPVPLPLGAPLPAPGPSQVSPLAIVANFVLIVAAIAALVYVLQKIKHSYSLKFFLGVMAAMPLYLALGRLVMILAGYNAYLGYEMAVYFSPIAVAIAIKFSLMEKWKPQRLSWSWKTAPRGFDDYTCADDALAAASKLEMRGEFSAAWEFYDRAAKRWPEHAEYARQCLDRVAHKQSLANG